MNVLLKFILFIDVSIFIWLGGYFNWIIWFDFLKFDIEIVKDLKLKFNNIFLIFWGCLYLKINILSKFWVIIIGCCVFVNY